MIYVPEVGMRVRGLVGIVRDVALWKHDGRPAEIYIRGERVWIDKPWRMNRPFWKKDFLGKTVVVGPGTARELPAEGEVLHVVRLEHIEAIVPAGTKITESFEPERCLRCPSGGEANILMDADGYCPQCGLNAGGERKPDKVETISEEEIWAMATPAEKIVLQQVHKIGPAPRVPGRVYFDMGKGG
jgi:hypothetical protein